MCRSITPMVDSILEGFGDPVVDVNEEDFVTKRKKISPFDFANAINYTKENLIVDETTEKEYNPFIVNRSMGFGKDTVIAGNEMNARPHLDNKLQFDFLSSVIRKSKRYSKWLKTEEENIEVVQKFFGYSFMKAKEALRLLSETDLEQIRLYVNTSKGGKI
jgi:hypothetical protein|tara:strand:- start:310 stop:792 length:483 start_codon:yes stop_codon:yes gene_type:complete